jgi:hypothetical protein
MQQIPFYDAEWLVSYWRAIELLSSSPMKLAQFKAAMAALLPPANFRAQLANLITGEEYSRMRSDLAGVVADDMSRHELFDFGRIVSHRHPAFDAIHQTVAPRLSALVGELVEPSYQFLAQYGNLGVCGVHLDAPSAKWTVDICIEQSAPWSIFVSETVPWPEPTLFVDENWRHKLTSDGNVRFTEFQVSPGDSLVFCGSSQWHYRNRIPRVIQSNHCSLLFLHYRAANTSSLVDQREWASRFDAEELRNAIRLANISQRVQPG